LALSGHANCTDECPLSGLKRTRRKRAKNICFPSKADIERGHVRRHSIVECRSFDEWVRAMKINATLLVEIPG
jgi:hypothetical protein